MASVGVAGIALVGCGDDDDDDDALAAAEAEAAAARAEAAAARSEAEEAGAAVEAAESETEAAAARAREAEAAARAAEAEAAEAAAATGAELGTADLLGIWGGGDELARFEAMVRPWEAATGGRMTFTGTRGLTELLTTRVAGGNPPDIALPPELGTLRNFARDGQLVPLSALGIEDEVRANYPAGFIDLGTVDGTLYAFAMKADTKGTIFYNPKLFATNGWEPLTVDSSFDDLIALSEQIAATGLTPWSMGVESGDASGWPGTDWVQEIILGEPGGAEVNDGVVDGSIPFTDARVKAAWEKFGQVALTPGYVVQGGATGINATFFVDASFPPFQDPPTAAMFYLGGFAAGFIADQFPEAVPGEDFDFFPFPGGGVAGGANVVYAFNDDDTTRSLMQYLASAPAQQIWVNLGGFNSVHKDIDFDRYPDPVSRRLAESLLNAKAFRFDLDDTVAGGFQTAFWVGITEYLANPGNLDDILASIEAARGT
ncbi:MAG: ABC transporter substrate-binding protein [Dehalococcoidia bacterium]